MELDERYHPYQNEKYHTEKEMLKQKGMKDQRRLEEIDTAEKPQEEKPKLKEEE